MTSLSDAELLEQYVSIKDESAFAELAQLHATMVWRTCLRVLNDRHEAEDAAQAAFLILARRADSFRSEQSVAGWLYGIAWKVAHAALRARSRRSQRLQEFKEVATMKMAAGLNADFGSSAPEQQADWEAIDRELNALSAHHKQAVILRYLLTSQ